METKDTPKKLIVFMLILSIPILVLYFFLFLDTFSIPNPDNIWPQSLTFKHWRFLFENLPDKPSIWSVTFNTIVFASSVVVLVLTLSSTAGYALSRLRIPARGYFLGTILMLHSFPGVSLLIAIFVMLQMLGLYDTLIGVIIIKASLELPFGIWIMKGFYDVVPWEIEMAGVQDGASRFQVWYKLILPQIYPGFAALAIFSFISSWGEYILPFVLAPSADVQTLSVYLAGLLSETTAVDYGLLKAVGLFYMIPVMIFYIFTQEKLMNIYGGGSKG